MYDAGVLDDDVPDTADTAPVDDDEILHELLQQRHALMETVRYADVHGDV